LRAKNHVELMRRASMTMNSPSFINENSKLSSVGQTSVAQKGEAGSSSRPRSRRSEGSTTGLGLKFESRFVPAGEDPYKQIKWAKRSSQISGADGSVVFAMDAAEVPESWSQLATDIVVSKYFRRAGVPVTGHETSVRQLVHRVAHTIRTAGSKFKGYFASEQDAEQFEKELVHILLTQKGAFNSPVWFNCGLFHEYGTKGSGGHWAWQPESNEFFQTQNSYENPQCSACFIQSVNDDLMGIFDLLKNEARIFKFGSGTGTNFSKIRGGTEKLSGGGTSSGLMSFLEVLDRAAGATKSGGTTRRAAKMVCLDMDHPEIADFITWKMREEKKVAALVAGGYSSDFNGDAYKTVSGQNSNNSVRIPDSFMAAVERDGEWHTTARTTGAVVETFKARDLWHKIAEAAWVCADPGVQFDTHIQKAHTCPETDRINSSNPCSEYMFLDDSACNLSSLNLVKFLNEDGTFDHESYRHAARILLTAQEILVDFSSYPTEQIARNSHDYRPLGLGYANLGTLLMIKGIAYDSPKAVAWAGALTALMHGEAFRTSAEIAKSKGPFVGYAKNAKSMMKVMKNHQSAISQIDSDLVPKDLMAICQKVWHETIELGEEHGYRNAQATVLAPTGTIGLLMDCDTTGIEPDFALVKFKKLAGGGYFKIVNQSVPKALMSLGYSEQQITDIVEYAVGTMSLEKTPHINLEILKQKGANEADIQKISAALAGAFDLNSAIAPWVIGDEGLARLGLSQEKLAGRSILEALGFTHAQIKEASKVVCGQMMIEGAPHLKPQHLTIFDCANKCGAEGTRFIEPAAHIRMMAAAQPFLSGAISKTVNMPHESSVEEIKEIYHLAWKVGLKAVAIYRDGSKMSQPLSGKSDQKDNTDGEDSETQSAVGTEVVSESVAAAAKPAAKSLDSLVVVKKQKLPQRRHGLTVEARVGGHKIFLRTGEYQDGRLGEIFIDMHKEGATLRSLLNCFAISVSMGLQYGVPLEDYVEKFTFTRFEPQGMVDHPNIKTATSILDYIFRVIGMEYLGKTDFVHVMPAMDELAINQSQLLAAVMNNVSGGSFMAAGDNKDLTGTKAAEGHGTGGSSDAHSVAAPTTTYTSADPLNAQLSTMMGDAPMCSTCGHVTVRNGSCYRCLNCGNSMGCS
jgi:ribonucleoside-diphosphate reductase alpha chain